MPWRGRTTRSALALLAGLALAACADQAPVQLPSTYAPPVSTQDHRLPAGTEPCRVRVAQVQDLREDPQSAGALDTRFVHAEDAPAWLRSGLLSLSRDERLDVSATPGATAPDLTIRVELLKLYILQINEAKSANVVVRIHVVGPSGPSEDKVYRGRSTSLDWTGSPDEIRAALDAALADLLGRLDHDLALSCAQIANGR